MSVRAWIYIWTVLLVGGGLSGVALLSIGEAGTSWTIFGVLLFLAASTQLLEAEGQNHEAYYPHFVFFFAGVVILPASLLVLLIIIPHLVEWAKKRLTNHSTLKQWYIQPFNIANFTIAAILSHWLYVGLQNNSALYNSPIRVFFVLLIALAFVMCENLLVSGVLYLARNITPRQSKILTIERLSPELILTNMGYVVVILWAIDPWLLIPALSPIIILYEALKVPKLKQEAQTDVKTGLLNVRHFDRLFDEELARAKRFNRPLTYIMADLDLMRNINNKHGHLAGDMVLAGIGKIIRDSLRQFDIAGRFGGEEFVIALPEVTRSEAALLAERLRATIAETAFPLPNSTETIHATMSIGFACFPYDAREAVDLSHAADIAVYHAKHIGRNQVAYIGDVPAETKIEYNLKGQKDQPLVTNLGDSAAFQEVVLAEPPAQMKPYLQEAEISASNSEESMEQQLRLALARNELEVYYQPQVNLTTQTIIGMEALVRWNHPGRGMVGPVEFIPIAEQSGLIFALEAWVLQQACQQTRLWNNNRPVAQALTISVNLSALEFERPAFIKTLTEVLDQTRLNPNLLFLEVTESLLLKETDSSRNLLGQIKKLGVRMAIDDFGTGYANFSYLKDLAVDIIKIPRTFIEQLNDNPRKSAIVQAIINLGHSLDIAIIAEGAENSGEVAHLDKLGCELVQGYYYARPMPSREVEAMLTSTPKARPGGKSPINPNPEIIRGDAPNWQSSGLVFNLFRAKISHDLVG